jgi:hypothetical protein
MADGIRGMFVVAALISGASMVAGCSGSDGASDVADDRAAAATPGGASPALPAPPAPPSPLPPELQLDGGAADGNVGTAPVDPGFRTMWAVDGQGRLARFTSAEPAKVTTRTLTGLPQGERILAMDFRPSDGKLYALGASSRLYVVDREKGVVTAVGAKAFTPALAGSAFGFDVNPVADKMRVHSDYDQNLRIDPTTGLATNDGMLTFGAGDPNEGQSPNLVATAYTNSVSPAPAQTQLYAIDSTRNLLAKFAAPNDGKVATVGALGVDVADVAGFDIWGGTSASGASRPLEAYAVLAVGTETGLYAIDLDKGEAKLIGAIEVAAPLRGLAIEP